MIRDETEWDDIRRVGTRRDGQGETKGETKVRNGTEWDGTERDGTARGGTKRDKQDGCDGMEWDRQNMTRWTDVKERDWSGQYRMDGWDGTGRDGRDGTDRRDGTERDRTRRKRRDERTERKGTAGRS